MIFERMNGNSRLVKVYQETVSFEINDESQQAHKLTGDGRMVSVPYTHALSMIAGYRERDERVYRYELKVSPRKFYSVAGWTLITVTSLWALWLLVRGWLV